MLTKPKLTVLFTTVIISVSSVRVMEDGMPPMKPDGARDLNVQKDEDMPDLMAIMNECNETFRIEMAFLEALNDSGTFPDETDKTPKCYMRCFLEKSGVASLDGQYDAARAASVFAQERNGRSHDDLEDSATSCTNRSETCKCERAYNFMRCLVEKDIEKHEAPYIAEPEEDS